MTKLSSTGTRAVLLVALLWGAAPGARILAALDREAYGKTLAEWLTLYWRWNMAGSDPATGGVGNVKFLPIPQDPDGASGSWTKEDPGVFSGHLDLTIPYGTPLVIPMLAWIGEVYLDGSTDPVFPDEWFGTRIWGKVTIDGNPIMEPLHEYYVPPTPFDPPVMYAAPTDYGSTGAIYFQGFGTVLPPLEPGVHEMKLYDLFDLSDLDPFQYALVFDNTWTITVEEPPYGKSLAEWLTLYWRWSIAGADPATGGVGNVKFLPIPQDPDGASGSWTKEDPGVFSGHLDLTIPYGTPLVIPMLAWIGEVYEDGSTDPVFPDDWFGTRIWGKVTIDGNPIMEPLHEYYVPPTPFDPPVMYAAPTDYGSTGAIYFQGFGTVLPPLEPGVHEMKLYDLFDLSDLDPFQYALVFDNTWTITVEPPQPVFQVVAYRWGAQRWRWNPFPFFQGWLQARFENTGKGGAHNVEAQISYTPANNQAADPSIDLGDIPAGATAWSKDTFSVITDMSKPADPKAGIQWTVEYDDDAGNHHVVDGIPQSPPPK